MSARRRAAWRAWATRALPALIIVYGALLRLDAVTQSYGAVAVPGWLSLLQQESAPRLRALHPATLSWSRVPLYPHRDGIATRYFSDPYTYLQAAREMRSFAGAHVREPIFPFVTKQFLRWLHDQDVAVSFASTAFSILGIAATYLLGAAAFGRAAGTIAAAGLAIEYDVITWGTAGWRDDAFLAAIVMYAYALVRYLGKPSPANGLAAGVAAGLACLVRLTSISFIVPGLSYVAIAAAGPWRSRARDAGAAVLAMTVIAAPYVVNCWRVYGDPLYAIDAHTGDQLVLEARMGSSLPAAAPGAAPSALGYFRAKFASRPVEMIDTLAIGLTAYPFQNKWSGFDVWAPWSVRWLEWASAAGLFLFAGSRAGRLLLLLLATSLIPFAATWKLAADWRFTEYAYPFFLVAAGLAIRTAMGGLVRLIDGPRAAFAGVRRTRSVFWLVLGGAVACAAWSIVMVLPPLTIREALVAHEDVTIMAGGRDAAFFRGGWRPARVEGSTAFRLTSGGLPEIRLPLPRVEEYSMTIRLDPFPRPPSEPLPAVQIFFNRQLIANVPTRWDPVRVGAYDLKVPSALVRAGDNRLIVRSSDPSRPIGVWYVRIRPQPAAAPKL